MIKNSGNATAVSGSCSRRWLITPKFNITPGIVSIQMVTELVKFEGMHGRAPDDRL